MAKVTLDKLLHNMDKVMYSHPLRSSAFDALRAAASDPQLRTEWESNANGVTPIIHHRVPRLLDDFLAAKVKYGSTVERKLYTGRAREWLVTRLLTCRPLVFCNPSDTYLLKSGTQSEGGFEMIGTRNERRPLVLEDYLSYDEMALAALVSVAVPTHFINAGDRFNQGRHDEPGRYERRGVYVGCVGARFEVPGKMEWQHVLVTPKQNMVSNGYGEEPPADGPSSNEGSDEVGGSVRMRCALQQAWARAYGCAAFPTYEEARRRPSEYYEICALPKLCAQPVACSMLRAAC